MDSFGSFEREVSVVYECIKTIIPRVTHLWNTITASQWIAKSDGSPVTIADLAVQTILISAIRKAFPDDQFLGEEHPDSLPPDFVAQARSYFDLTDDPLQVCATNISAIAPGTSRVWVMDPIDGTVAFANRGQYAISVALLVDLENTVNVIGWPNHSSEFTGLPIDGAAIFAAVKGRGSYALDLSGGIFPVRVGENPRPLIAWNGGERRVAMINDQKERLGLTGDIRMMSMVKAIIVATGGARLYCKAFMLKEPIWDVAPVELFVREAGGIVTNVDEKPLYCGVDGKMDNSERGCVFTSNGPRWHRLACEVIRSHVNNK